jgi:CheY-like chemotaxis protein
MNTLSNTILLAEDNEDDVFALKWAFKRAQVTNPLQVVTDGQQAVDYLSGAGEFSDRERFPLPFLLFLDLKMPYLNGFDVLAWMKQRPELESIAVIVLTSSDEARDHQKAYELGARSYLVKPPERDEITQILNSLQSLWMRHEQTPVLTQGR